ncbi:unnamed protein product [Clonostachys solani]|uniref:Uncharacterized protein n=1 Tax=Clonostachys solani TaxID=160281 RepID=A0A9N9ZM56_9HYPO|nr:unnamed protein product [Clonostachys solani]
MAQAMDTKVPTESTLSSAEVSQYLHRDVQNEAALAVLAAAYPERTTSLIRYRGEFARCFEIIRDRGEATWTSETLEAAIALQPAIDYYTEELPRELLLLPPFAETKTSTDFGPLPPVADLDLHRFQRALYRFDSTCPLTSHPNHYVSIHYYHDREAVSPYSDVELNQVSMLREMLFYRMSQVCGKYLDSVGKRQGRPDRQDRKFRDKNTIHGIMSHGLQFMYELEMQTTDKGIEEVLQRVSLAGRWSGPQPRKSGLSEELCILRRTLDERLGYKPRGCGEHEGRECYEEEVRFRNKSDSRSRENYSKQTDLGTWEMLKAIATWFQQSASGSPEETAAERARTRQVTEDVGTCIGQIHQRWGVPRVPAEQIRSGNSSGPTSAYSELTEDEKSAKLESIAAELKQSTSGRPEETAAERAQARQLTEDLRTRISQMKQKQKVPRVPAEQIRSGDAHPAGDD